MFYLANPRGNRLRVAAKLDSRIFQGFSWSVSRLVAGRTEPLTWNFGSQGLSLASTASWHAHGSTPSPDRHLNGGFSDVRDRRRRRDEKMVPNDPPSLGRKTICLQPLQSRPQSPR